MFEKRTYYKFIKNWQKTIATAFLILIVSTCTGQTSVEAEFSTKNGLPSDIGRVVIDDGDGGVWVGTDGGIKHFPSGNSTCDQIERAINHSQVWAIEFQKDWMYVGTYDNGLFIFNKNDGKLINHIQYEKLPKIRKFRKFKENIYGIYYEGIFHLNGPNINVILQRQFYRIEKNLNKVRTFPLEIFEWENRLNVIVYNSKYIYSSEFENIGKWDSTNNFLPGQENNNYLKTITSAYSWKDKLYIGTAGFGLFVADTKSTKHFKFKSLISQSLTAWDIKSDNDELYIGFGNHIDLSEGFILRYSDIESSSLNNEIRVQDLIRTPFIWSITPDNVNQSLWVATVNEGINYYPSLKNNRVTPEKMDRIHTTEHYLIGSHLNKVYIQKKDNHSWKTITLKNSTLISCLEYNQGIILHCNNMIYLWKNDQLILNFENSSSFIELVDSKLYLFNVFGNASVIDLNEKETTPNNIKSNFKGILSVTSDNKRIIVQTQQNDFFLIQEKECFPLKTDFLTKKIEYQFSFYGDLLVLHSGHEYKFCTINDDEKLLKTKFVSSSEGLFPNTKIKWSYTDLNSGFWVGNDEVAFQLSLSLTDSSFRVMNQYYLGKMDMYRTVPLVKYGKILIQRHGYIQRIHCDAIPSISQNARINIKHKNAHHLGELILPRIFMGENANFIISSNNYFYHQYGSVEYWIHHKGEASKHIIQPAKLGIWLNNYEAGIYRIQISNGFETFSTLLRVNERIFWALIIVILLLGSYLYQWNQYEQFKIEQKMVSLEIATLRSNLNPHFIFNTMNLIQSLIVRNQNRKALQATSDLAQLNRKFLENSNLEFVSLKKEIGFIQDYINLEKMRFEEDQKFEFSIEITNEVNLDNWKIPPLILQPILENAVKHGALLSKNEQYLKVQITLNTPLELQIVVINPFEPNLKNSHGTGIGLKLVKDRLSLINQRYQKRFFGDLKIQKDPDAKIYIIVVTFNRFS